MVCSVGGGRMAVMVRLLDTGIYSQDIAENVTRKDFVVVQPGAINYRGYGSPATRCLGHVFPFSHLLIVELGYDKLAARYADRGLCETDEANLLDEEDMHVFGLEPMSDPLYLVCCNACKKPIKASQYAAHAELCQSLKPIEASGLENDVARAPKKPPRKERKKTTVARTNQAMPVGVPEQGRCKVDTTSLEPYANWQHELASSFRVESKRNSTAIDTATIIVDSGLSPQNTDKPVGLVESSTKRYKMMWIPSDCTQPTDDPKQDSGELTARGSARGILSRTEKPTTICKDPAQGDQCCKLQNGLPVPLTAKIYYSQRNTRFRLALTHLYHETSKKIGGDVMGSQSPVEGIDLVQTSSVNGFPSKEADHITETKQNASVLKSCQMLRQSSEASLVRSGEHLPNTNLSNQLPVEIAAMPQAAAFGLTRSKYVSKPYSFVGNSVQLLGTIQQQNGSVPVV